MLGAIHQKEKRPRLTVGQKTGVMHHPKTPSWNIADLAADHFFLAQRQRFMLSHPVVEAVVNHRAATVMPQCRVRVIYCQSQSGRMYCCSATHCLVEFKPQALQAFDSQFWQKMRERVKSGKVEHVRAKPMP